jgi:hypothetical protein
MKTRMCWMATLAAAAVFLAMGPAAAPAAAQVQNPIQAMKDAWKKAQAQARQQEQQQREQQQAQQNGNRNGTQAAAPQSTNRAASQAADPAVGGAGGPIPDSECCTPAAMQKFAKQASFLDLVGIRLGMTPKEAVAAVRAFDPQLKIAFGQGKVDIPGVPREQYPEVPGFAVAYTGVNPSNSYQPATGSDVVWIEFTQPPNPPLVAKITRSMVFPSGHPVFASTLLAALRKKYGHENVPVGSGNSPVWIYGPDGKLLQRRLNQTTDERYCGWARPGNRGIQIHTNPFTMSAADITWDQYAKDRSYSPVGGNYFYEAIPVCFPFTILTTEGGDLITSPQALNYKLDVSIESPALLYASYRSTQEWLEAKAEAAQQKEEQSLKKNAAPKF